MSGPQFIDAAQVARLDVAAAVDALADAFAGGTEIDSPARMQLPMGDATFLVMPATGPVGGHTLAGAKLVTVRPGNAEVGAPSVQATYVVFGGTTAAPLAVIDGTALTGLRTSAVSALATRLLAPRGASRLVVFGAGAQARAHVEAMCAVRPITQVVVVGRSPANAAALVERARRRGLRARPGTPADVADAEIVCTCTTSEQPLFDGTLLADGAHVNAVGAYQPHARELDDATVRRARVVVEDRAAVLAEAGEVIIPIRSGVLAESGLAADLAQVCRGAEVRREPGDITVFKSVGLAMEDLVVAAALLGADGR